ncbi:hypothetical protein SAMN06295967_1011, partial [Belliella buryatensis]
RCKSTIPDQKNYLTPGGHFAALIGGHFDRYMQVTHNIAYAIGDSPYGPFTYQGVILNPVQGWTNHHSIVKIDSKWYIFYHDTELSGETHLRNIKMAELEHLADGTIKTIEPILK